MTTKQATSAKPTNAAVAKVKAVALRKAKDTAANGKAAPPITDADFLAYVESLEKGSDVLRKSRNIIFRKLAAKPLDEEVLKVLRELVALKTYAVVKRCWSEVRKENATAKADAVEADAEAE